MFKEGQKRMMLNGPQASGILMVLT